MEDILGSVEWIGELIPDLHSRLEPFIVDTDEVDDELIEVFIDELRRLSGELKEGLANNDAEMIRMASHSIKGMGGTIGLPELSVLGLEVENLAKENRLSEAAPLVDALAVWMTSFQ